MKKLIPFIIIFILLTYLGLYAYSLSRIEVSSVDFTDIRKVNSTGFFLDGKVKLFNNGTVGVFIDRVEYEIVLDFSNESLSRGVINGESIRKGEFNDLRLSSEISWNPAKDAALGLIMRKDINATVSGYVYIIDMGFFELKVPFSETIDIKPLLRDFIQSKIKNALDDLFG